MESLFKSSGYENLKVSPIYVLILLLLFIGCQKPSKISEVRMEQKSLNELLLILTNRTECITLTDGTEGGMIVTPALGGRIMGLSSSGLEGENLFWVHPDLGTDEFWEDTTPFFNPGGHRTWIAPEDPFYFDDQKNWYVPRGMDPGPYDVQSSSENSIVLTNSFHLSPPTGGDYQIELKREITLHSLPPEDIGLLSSEIEFIGYTLSHSLTNLSNYTYGVDVPYVGLWSLIQVNPSGTMIIPVNPVRKGEDLYTSYFDPILPERVNHRNNVLTVKIDGLRREKIGIAPHIAKGFISYISSTGEGNGILFIKKFLVDPAGTYLDNPWGVTRANGDCIQMYNDDGNMGSFAELECHGPSKTLASNESESHIIEVYVFAGAQSTLKKIGSRIMGINMEELSYF